MTRSRSPGRPGVRFRRSFPLATRSHPMTVLLALLLATPLLLEPAGLLAGPVDASSALCGNGRVDTFSGPVICAPCIPNRPCRCGPMPITEECDSADLGGRTCASLGFLGGALRCTPDCRLDRTGCQI